MKLLKIPREKSGDYDKCIRSKYKTSSHCHYMLYEMDNLLSDNKIEKVFRWLGFIQGCLFSFGLRSLEDLKNDSAPSN